MAIFTENEYDALDYGILRDGGISLYRRIDFMEEDIDRLREAAYHLFRIDCKDWKSEADMHDSLFQELSFPSYYGRNLDALHDVITDVPVLLSGGVALVFLHYDHFVRSLGPTDSLAEIVLDILSRASREFLLTGRRFLTFVQSDDPALSLPNLGGSIPSWNRREWLNKDRGL